MKKANLGLLLNIGFKVSFTGRIFSFIKLRENSGLCSHAHSVQKSSLFVIRNLYVKRCITWFR